MVLVGTRSLHVEGVYGLVDNLGSLVVRVVFQPFEEAAFTAFSRSIRLKMRSHPRSKAFEIGPPRRRVFQK